MFSSLLLANDLGELMNEELLPDPVPLFGSLFGDRFLVNPSFRTAFFLTGELVEYGDTGRLFSQPRDKRTEDYITGRFG